MAARAVHRLLTLRRGPSSSSLPRTAQPVGPRASTFPRGVGTGLLQSTECEADPTRVLNWEVKSQSARSEEERQERPRRREAKARRGVQSLPAPRGRRGLREACRPPRVGRPSGRGGRTHSLGGNFLSQIYRLVHTSHCVPGPSGGRGGRKRHRDVSWAGTAGASCRRGAVGLGWGRGSGALPLGALPPAAARRGQEGLRGARRAGNTHASSYGTESREREAGVEV